ncbi:hypothetical protein F7R25_04235 [Burkholderia stagnalis]|uniref:Uncharacterized protein n=1 Tax=Burkholderia stagnalis TaxID=1503054 RepID=A0A6L3N453_9BURK|nr:hypothetical protein [Burkholderia stagnalis]KAB0640714.1 hypothetical protein F7R25_04235 [Burkholderia stagnalis]VWB06982.1 hypothetical protein BST28156_00151 [Burkholderia stagnalis]
MSGVLETLGGLYALEKLGNQGREIDSLNLELDGNHQQLDHARRDLAAASGSIAYYKRVNKELTEKVQLLQEVNEDLRVTLADWIVSQRAFRELAMKYGALAGKTPKEIDNESSAAEEAVLKNEAKMSASNNVDTCSRAKPYKDRLLVKLQKEKARQ